MMCRVKRAGLRVGLQCVLGNELVGGLDRMGKEDSGRLAYGWDNPPGKAWRGVVFCAKRIEGMEECGVGLWIPWSG